MHKNLTREMHNHLERFQFLPAQGRSEFWEVSKLSLGVLSPTILKQRMLPHEAPWMEL